MSKGEAHDLGAAAAGTIVHPKGWGGRPSAALAAVFSKAGQAPHCIEPRCIGAPSFGFGAPTAQVARAARSPAQESRLCAKYPGALPLKIE